jgi:hypothetical protein
MEEIEEQLEDEDIVEDEEADAEEADEAAAAAAPASPKDAADGDVESIEELIVKKEERAAQEDDEDDSVLSLTREERLEPLAVKVVPPQPTEFVCKNCYLVKHRSQLKDKTRMLCRDCA